MTTFIVPDNLPATEILKEEHINFAVAHHIPEHTALLKILVLNLMPLKIPTENQLIRALSGTPYTIQMEFLHIREHVPHNTPQEHLDKFYHTFDEIRQSDFDGFIITGAPVELLEFEHVDYWKNLTEIMDWSDLHIKSTFFICWGAQAGLYYFHGVRKFPFSRKMSGIFEHRVTAPGSPLVKGFDNSFTAPHSKYTDISENDILKDADLEIVARSPQAGIYIVAEKSGKRIFVTGHSEYDDTTLRDEYFRDIKKGLEIHVPENYFPGNDPSLAPLVTWRQHSIRLFSNWADLIANGK